MKQKIITIYCNKSYVNVMSLSKYYCTVLTLLLPGTVRGEDIRTGWDDLSTAGQS